MGFTKMEGTTVNIKDKGGVGALLLCKLKGDKVPDKGP
jgi:hypothetical protein